MICPSTTQPPTHSFTYLPALVYCYPRWKWHRTLYHMKSPWVPCHLCSPVDQCHCNRTTVQSGRMFPTQDAGWEHYFLALLWPLQPWANLFWPAPKLCLSYLRGQSRSPLCRLTWSGCSLSALVAITSFKTKATGPEI